MMKNILIKIIIALSFSGLFAEGRKLIRSMEINSAAAFVFPLDKKDYINSDGTTLKYNMGFKINTGSLKFTGNCSMAAKDMKSLANEDFNQWIDNQKKTWGIQYRLSTRFLNIDFLAGTLKFSQGTTRLKNPVPSAPSPLSGSGTIGPGISPALPSSSSAESPRSVAFIISPGTGGGFLPTFQTGLLENGENFSSLFKRFSCKIIPSGSLSFCLGFFKHAHSNTNSWFQTQRYYGEKNFLAMEGSFNFSWNVIQISCAVGINESPFGRATIWTRTSTLLLAGNFSLALNTFFSEPDLISSAGNLIRTREMLFMNPQYKFYFGKNFIHLGLTAGTSSKETNTRPSASYRNYTGKACIKMNFWKFTTELNAGTNYSTENGTYENSGGLKISVPFNSMTLGSSISLKNEDATKNTWSGEIYATKKKGLIKNISAGFNIKDNLGEKSWTTDISIKLRHTWNRCTFNGSLAMSFKKK